MIINVNQLRAFHAAAKSKSITLAAQELMVTPPAVSMQVRKLEETLDVKLMFRNGNSIRLTEMGSAILRKCDRIFKQVKDMENYLEDISTAKSGVLKIGCPQTPAKYILPPVIAEFKKTYPGIRILLDQGTSAEMVKSILDHKNELAVVRCRGDEKRLKVKVLRREEILLVAAPKTRHILTDEISVTQLSTIPMILQKQGSAARDVILEYLRKFHVHPMIILESVGVELIKQLVSQDDGVGFLARTAVQEDLKNKNLKAVRILEGSPIIEYGIGYLRRASLSTGAWAFLRAVEKLDGITLNSVRRIQGQNVPDEQAEATRKLKR
jgi:DNA-binding transcriptional LysR family regulator